MTKPRLAVPPIRSSRSHPRRTGRTSRCGRRAAEVTLALGIAAVSLADAPPVRAIGELSVRVAGATSFVGPGQPVDLSVVGCPAGGRSWTVTDAEGRTTADGRGPASDPLRVPGTAAAGPGIYRATVRCGDRSGSIRFVRASGAPTTRDPRFSLAVSGSPGPAASARATFDVLGAGGHRQDLQWGTVEKRPGVFDFTPVDARVDQWVDAPGAAPLFVLDYGNIAHTGGPSHPPDVTIPAQRAAWERFVQRTVAHMRDRHPGADLSYEVWNEWTNTHGTLPATPEAYVALAAVTFDAIRGADPHARVVGPAANAVSVRERAWLQGWFDAGGARFVDAVSIHPYDEPWSPDGCPATSPCIERALDWVRTAASENPGPDGRPVPIWISEVGWPTANRNSVPELDLAAFLVRTNVLAAQAGVDRVYTFEMSTPDGPEPDDSRRAFGLVEGVETGYEPKPAAAAWLTMQRHLAGMRFVAAYSSSGGAIRQVRFDSPDRRRHVRVVWQTEDRYTTRQAVVALPSSGTLVDPYGATKTVTARNGRLTMTATWAPRYVVWED